MSAPPSDASQAQIQALPHARPVRWRQEGDVWVGFLHDAARRILGARQISASYQETPIPHHIYTLPDVLASHLWVAPADTDLLLFVAGPADAPPSDFTDWVQVVADADTRLSAGHSTHPYAALIGSAPGLALGPRLATPAFVGPVSLRPGDDPYVIKRPSSPPMIGAELLSVSWPIVAEGTAEGYDAQGAMLAASRDIYLACLVLGVAWGVAHELRHGAQPIPPGILGVPVSPAHAQPDPIRPTDYPTDERTIPDWADEAFGLLASRPEMQAIFGAFREGQLLQMDHPSMALLAYSACLDGIGRLMFPGLGNHARFTRALESVVPPAELAGLLSGVDLFELRNDTTHEGILHGREATMGHFNSPGFLTDDPAWRFSFMTMYILASAARELLRRLLAGEATIEPVEGH